MFGKKGGVLGSWLKEFGTLVFIQTIQAFIYALVIAMIVNLEWSKISDVGNRYSGMGILSIIALVSVFKVEEMVKKIFGIEKSRADVKGAMSSLAKTAIAWQFGKKVLDNGGKIKDGIKTRMDAKKSADKTLKRFKRDRSMYDLGDEDTEDSNAGLQTNSQNDAAQNRLGSNDQDTNQLDNTQQPQTNTNQSANDTAVRKKKNLKEARDYQAMCDRYNDKLDEIKKQSAEGKKNIYKGLLETTGAAVGGVTGAIIGGADGNLDEALRGAAVGMGIGDTFGGAVVEKTSAAIDSGKSAKKSFDKMRAAVRSQEITGEGLTKAKNKATAYYNEIKRNQNTTKELESVLKRANEAIADNAN